MTPEQRRDKLLVYISKQGNQSLDVVSKEFGISTRTLRRDVKQLPLIIIDGIIQYPDINSMSLNDNVKTQKLRGSALGATPRTGNLQLGEGGSIPSSHKPSPFTVLESSNIQNTSNTKNLELNSNTQFAASSPPGHEEKLPIPPLVAEIANIQGYFKQSGLNCTVKDAIELRDKAMQFAMNKETPPFNMPPRIISKGEMVNGEWIEKQLYDPITEEPTEDRVKGISKQELIINAINNPTVEIVAIEADKRKGKSTAWFVGVCKGVWNEQFKAVGLWASGEENAKGILGDVFTDDISQSQTRPLFKGFGSNIKKVFYNDVPIKAFCNNAASFSGFDLDCCVIDEAHEVVVEHKEVFDMIIMTMRAKPQIKLILAMNKGTGTYHLFEKTLREEFGKEVRFYTIEDEDIVHITEKADAKVRTLVKAVGGQGEVDRWLNNKKSLTGSSFNPISIENSFDSYEAFFQFVQPKAAFVVLSYDPSGSGHPSGWWCGACDIRGEQFWELESGEYQLGADEIDVQTGKGWTREQIYQHLIKNAVKYKINMFLAESNQNGKHLVLDMKIKGRTMGFKAKNQNFGDEKNKKGYSRGAMISMVAEALDNDNLHLCGEILYPEMTIYNPDEHDKSAKFKGDCADAMIHGVVRLMIMSKSKYIKRGRGIKVSAVY